MDSARDGPPRHDGRPPKRLTGRLHPSAVAGPVGRQGVERIEGQYKGAPRQRSRHRQRTPVRCAHRARTYRQRNPVR
jgi:hypothetical protein